MSEFRATIRTTENASDAGGTGAWVVDHHLTEQAAIDVEYLSGGHLLHLAVAGCLFNDLLREAANRGITVHHLAVSAWGDFDQDGSRGVEYAIDIRSADDRSVVERLIGDIEADATIPKALRTGVPVNGARITVTTD